MPIRDLLEDLLALAQTWVPEATRALVTQGRPAGDCGLLAVWVEQFDAGPPGVKTACSVIPRALFHVSYFNCTPVLDAQGNPPSAEAITDNALDFADAGEAIWWGIIAAWSAGTLFEGMTCNDIDLTRGMLVKEPLGGLAGWDASIIVTLT